MIAITYRLRSGNTYTDTIRTYYDTFEVAREMCDYIENIGGIIIKVVIM